MANNLFRRHRNRDAEDSPPESAGNAGGVDGGRSGESSSAMQNEDIELQNINSHSSNNNATITDAAATTITAASPQTDEEVQELIGQLPNNTATNSAGGPPSPFVLPAVAWEPSEEATALRREAIHRELERVQRANFIHFLVLCLVPTTLLIIVIAAIVGEDTECGHSGEIDNNGLTVCEREPRSFVNAFTSRCICEAVRSVAAVNDLDSGAGEGV